MPRTVVFNAEVPLFYEGGGCQYSNLSDEASARVFTTVTVVGHYHITIHIIFDIAFVICIQWL
jgi:hypothetical protein